MSQNGYFSTQNGNGTPGNFGVSGVVRTFGVQGNVANYTMGLNNAGLLPQGANVNTQTNVMAGLVNTTNNNSSVQQQVNAGVTSKTLNVNEYNGNLVQNIVGPKIRAYASETSVNTYQN